MSSIQTVAVLGAGTMGAGIAELAAGCGIEARLFDVSDEVLTRGLAAIEGRLARRLAKQAISQAERDGVWARLRRVASLGEAVAGADVIIEAVPENMDLKVRVLSEARAAAADSAVLGSNTSSLSITELGARVGAPERVVGLHFFNPPPVMPLIEIVRGLGTSADTLSSALGLVKQLKKESIVVQDSPGFATSRLGVILGAEAMRMLETGVASVLDIDRAMELGYRHPMGPLMLTDLVGLDVRLSILEHLQRELGDQFRPPALLRKLVRAGKLGKKSGTGFYVWTSDGPTPNPELSR